MINEKIMAFMMATWITGHCAALKWMNPKLLCLTLFGGKKRHPWRVKYTGTPYRAICDHRGFCGRKIITCFLNWMMIWLGWEQLPSSLVLRAGSEPSVNTLESVKHFWFFSGW